MQDIIKRLEKESFSSDEILDSIDGEANLMSYSELSKYNNIDEALGPHKALVLLYESRKNYGHWVCVFKTNHNTIEFFDPYSLKPDDELDYIPKNFRKANNQEYPHLTYLLYNSGYEIEYNDAKLQKLKKNINTCGRHVVLRLILRNVTIDEYIKLFDGKDADFLVTALTTFIK